MAFDFADSYESADEVPAEFRTLYEEGDDGVVFNAERYAGVRKAYLGKDKALKKAREGENRSRAQVLSAFQEYGEDPESILSTFQERLQAAEEKARAEAPKGATDEDVQKRIDKLRTEMTAAHQQKLEEREGLVTRYRGQLEAVLGEQAALSALSGKALDPDLALPFVMKHIRTVEGDDGSLKVVVVDEEGIPRENLVTSAAFSISDLVEEMAANEKYAPLFRSESPKGGGSHQSPRPAAGQSAIKARQAANLRPTEKIALGLRKGQARKS